MGSGLSRLRRSGSALFRDEEGEATVEFIGLMLVLVVPLLYLVLTLAQVQAGLFAAEGGAREAARVLADDPGDQETALAQVALAFADFGVPSEPVTLIGCRTCAGPARDVSVTVSTSIPLPLLPAWAGRRLAFPVSATSVSLVDGVRLDE